GRRRARLNVHLFAAFGGHFAAMQKLLFAAAAMLALIAAAPADLEAETAPLLKRAEAASGRGEWAAAIGDLRTVRDMAAQPVGASDPKTLHINTLLVQTLTQAGQYEQAIAEGVTPLRAYSAPATKNNIDGLYLRYYLAQAFQKCRATRCGDEAHRTGN